MARTVMVVLIGNRLEAAEKVQKILTGWGCLIKTRLGLHDGVLDNCTERGLVILELVGTDEQKKELQHKLSLVQGVAVQTVSLSVD